MKLTQLSLNGNPGSADFKPTAMAGPEGGIDVPQGATTGITLGVEVPENGYDDPWGTNVTYAWSRTEGTGGTLTDATAAQAVFTPPATDGTHAFRLTVTGGGGVAGTSTVSVHVGAAGVPPMPVSAVVNGPTLTLTYSKNLQAEPPPASDSGKGQVTPREPARRYSLSLWWITPAPGWRSPIARLSALSGRSLVMRAPTAQPMTRRE